MGVASNNINKTTRVKIIDPACGFHALPVFADTAETDTDNLPMVLNDITGAFVQSKD